MKSGVECYQDGLHSAKANMSLEDFNGIAEQCRDRTWQFALGGCGEQEGKPPPARLREPVCGFVFCPKSL